MTGSKTAQDDSVAAANFLQSKNAKKITASLILLKRGLEFKTNLKKGVVRKVEKKTWKKQPNIAYSNLHTAKFLSLFPFVLLPLKWKARGPESAK